MATEQGVGLLTTVTTARATTKRHKRAEQRAGGRMVGERRVLSWIRRTQMQSTEHRPSLRRQLSNRPTGEQQLGLRTGAPKGGQETHGRPLSGKGIAKAWDRVYYRCRCQLHRLISGELRGAEQHELPKKAHGLGSRGSGGAARPTSPGGSQE
jgi:hypothetical protein